MFTSQVQGILSQLSGFLPQQAIDAMIQVFGNCAQEIDHRGPVNISTYGAQPTLNLNNGMPNQDALNIDNGNVVIGPVGGGTGPQGGGGTVTVNDTSTFNNPVTFNNETYYYDDLVMANGDLIIKYCDPGMGSTLARVKLDAPLVGGSGPAHIVDCDGNPVNNNASGQGGDGSITVHDCSASNESCGQKDDCGFAVYMSDCAAGGAVVDCNQRPNGGKWELIKIKRTMADGVCSTRVVDNVCCVDGQLVVCKKTIVFSEPVTVTVDACTCPP